MYRFLFSLTALFAAYNTECQVLPKEAAKLHYRMVGFSVPAPEKATSYKFEIATGYYNTEDSFLKNITLSLNDKTNKTIAEVPAFGKEYTWRVITTVGNSTVKSELRHFATIMNYKADTHITRCRVIKPATKYKDAYVFYDGTRTLYDMKGHPLWYLPDISGLRNDDNIELCDLKLSPSGTITFILGAQACEINYNGQIIWKGPDNGVVSGDSVEHYHHEFTRLSNGHYMVIGKEYSLLNISGMPVKDSSLLLLHGNKIKQDSLLGYMQKGFLLIPFGTIIEYDEKGTIVWSWKLSKYFSETPVNYYKPPAQRGGFDPHENAFFFDENKRVVYVSLRNISRVIKVSYPDGTVLNTYSELYKNGLRTKGSDLFCEQHSPRISSKGHLYVFNNNSCNESPGIPKITVMEEPAPGSFEVKKTWEYDCGREAGNIKKIATGGNVMEMRDGSFFVCLGKEYSTTFIVSNDKNIQWSAVPERWNIATKKWDLIPQYRASIFTKEQLEHMIWNDEKSNYHQGH